MVAIATTKTFAHTCTGTELALFVLTSINNATDASRNITGITYNGDALTQVREDNDDTGNMTSEIWRLINPDTGTNNIVVSWAGTGCTIAFSGISFTGADQTNPVDASNGAAGTGTAASVAVTSVTDTAYVIDAQTNIANSAQTIGAGQTTIYNGAGASVSAGHSYEGPQSPAGAVTMSWTWTFSNAWVTTGVAVKPASVAPGASGVGTNMLMTGVGI